MQQIFYKNEKKFQKWVDRKIFLCYYESVPKMKRKEEEKMKYEYMAFSRWVVRVLMRAMMVVAISTVSALLVLVVLAIAMGI